MRWFSYKKICCEHVLDQFLWTFKDTHIEYFDYDDKTMPWQIFQGRWKHCKWSKDIKHHFKRKKKMLNVMFFNVWIRKKWCHFWEKITQISLFQDLLEKPNFSERLSFHREMLDLTNLWLDICVCIVNAMIFIKKNCLPNFFKISSIEFLKGITILIIFICTNSYAICDVWSVTFQTWFFIRFRLWCLDRVDQGETNNTQSVLFKTFLVKFQNWSKVAVVCTLYLARPHNLLVFCHNLRLSFLW